MRVVAITGSRYWDDRAAIERVLEGAELLLVGDCETGADLIALETAMAWDVIAWVFCADPARAPELVKRYGNHLSARVVSDWQRSNGRVLNKGAGPIRNEAVATNAASCQRELGMDVAGHAFILPSSVGTIDCMGRMRVKGLHVEEHRP